MSDYTIKVDVDADLSKLDAVDKEVAKKRKAKVDVEVDTTSVGKSLDSLAKEYSNFSVKRAKAEASLAQNVRAGKGKSDMSDSLRAEVDLYKSRMIGAIKEVRKIASSSENSHEVWDAFRKGVQKQVEIPKQQIKTAELKQIEKEEQALLEAREQAEKRSNEARFKEQQRFANEQIENQKRVSKEQIKEKQKASKEIETLSEKYSKAEVSKAKKELEASNLERNGGSSNIISSLRKEAQIYGEEMTKLKSEAKDLSDKFKSEDLFGEFEKKASESSKLPLQELKTSQAKILAKEQEQAEKEQKAILEAREKAEKRSNELRFKEQQREANERAKEDARIAKEEAKRKADAVKEMERLEKDEQAYSEKLAKQKRAEREKADRESQAQAKKDESDLNSLANKYTTAYSKLAESKNKLNQFESSAKFDPELKNAMEKEVALYERELTGIYKEAQNLVSKDTNTLTMQDFNKNVLNKVLETDAKQEINAKKQLAEQNAKVLQERQQLEKEMVDSYQKSLENSNKLVSESAKGTSNKETINALEQNVNDYLSKYNELRSKLQSEFGATDEELNKIISTDVKSNMSKASINDGIQQNIDAKINMLKDLQKKVEELPDGALKTNLQDKINNLLEPLMNLDSSFKGGNYDTSNLDHVKSITDQLKHFSEEIPKLAEEIKPIDTKKIGKIDTLFDDLLDEKTLGTKIEAFKSNAESLKKEYQTLMESFVNGDISQKDLTKGLDDILKKAQDLKKVSSSYEYSNKKGTLIKQTFGDVKDIKEIQDAATDAMTQFANINNLGKFTGKEKVTGDSITRYYADSSGVVTSLTANMQQYTNAVGKTETGLRLLTSSQTSANSAMQGFGSFVGSTVKQMMAAYTGIQMINKVMQSFRQGVQDLVNFDSALTNISYTMDVNERQLGILGDGIIDMAKDLKMSISDSEDIFKIYANAKTNINEIKELARPTAVLGNLAGIKASDAADDVQAVIEQFNLTADASSHIVDVYDYISSQIKVDYSKLLERTLEIM